MKVEDGCLKVCPGEARGRVFGPIHDPDIIRDGNSPILYRGTYANAGQGASYETKDERKGMRDSDSTLIFLHTDNMHG